MLLSGFNASNYSLLALAFRTVDVSAAAVLFETWPIIFVALRRWLNQQSIHFNHLRAFTPAIMGTILVAASQHPDEPSFFHIDSNTGLGAMIAIVGGTAAACTAFTFRWADQAHDDLFNIQHTQNHHPSQGKTCTALVMIAFMLTNMLALPINVITAVQICLSLLTGTFIQGSGSILFRLANVFTQNPGINAIYYAAPCLTIICLLILHQPIPNPHYLAMGTAAIVASNLILVLRPIRTSP